MKKSPGYGTQNFYSFCKKKFNFLTIFKINVVPKNRGVQYHKKYKPQVPKLFTKKKLKIYQGEMVFTPLGFFH